MSSEFVVALFLMGVGLSTAGAGTHLYQMVWNTEADLTVAGRNYVSALGNLAFSFLCGPYIMLQKGLRPQGDGTLSVSLVLLAAFVAFGWAFITGIMLVGIYLACAGA